MGAMVDGFIAAMLYALHRDGADEAAIQVVASTK
jgi:hypothetical protein